MEPARHRRRNATAGRDDGLRGVRAPASRRGLTPDRFDVAVVGGGPAGCAAAIVLAAAGAEVVVLERTGYDGARIGETLPPEIRLPLERLGAWDRFGEAGHVVAPGIVAAWGGAEPYANDFILNPYGSGWRVDRNRFDPMLAERAQEVGAVVRARTGVEDCQRAAAGGWQVAVGGGERLRAAFVIDATGRSSSLWRALGARRVVHDRMVALVASAIPGDPDQRTLIEATPEGWWYSAVVPDGTLVLAFQTDPGPGLRARWAEYLAGAPATAARAGGAGTAGVRVVSANSHRDEPLAGDGWLAVGDAATAHDPLCGLGIYWALESGMAAAEAVTGGSEAMAAYGADMHDAFGRFLATRVEYYRVEDRWPDAPFWHRRRTMTAWTVAAGGGKR